MNATYNWWGTTNVQSINQKIYDNTDDFNLGKVTFEPFLDAPNRFAEPGELGSLTIPEISQAPSWMILSVFIVVTLAAISIGCVGEENKKQLNT